MKYIKKDQHFMILEMYYLRHAKHYGRNRTSLCRLDKKNIFFE